MKIISGGQTGVDRAALDFAMRHGLEYGGTCPHGRKAEDGRIDAKYNLRETDSLEYAERTKQNVLDSDATLIFVRHPQLGGGTALTHDLAVEHGRPVLVICECDVATEGAKRIAAFLKNNAVRILNVAGPRESEAPGLSAFVNRVLESVLSMYWTGSK